MHTSTVAALLRLGALNGGDRENILQEILRVVSDVLDVDRVSYWSLRHDPPSIVCELGYIANGRTFERGHVLLEADAGHYFEAIRGATLVEIEDAAADPRGHALVGYLEAHGIGALLDAPVYVRGRLAGVLCLEHVGGPRRFDDQAEQLALAVAQILSARLEARARSDAEDSERRTAFLSEVLAGMEELFDPRAAAEMAVKRAVPTLADTAMLVGFERGELRVLSSAHVDPGGLALVEEMGRRETPSLDGPGFAVYALRHRESVLVPEMTRDSARAYGIDDEYWKLIAPLKLLSAIAVPLRVRGEFTGAMTLGSVTRRFGQADLRFAERYGQRIGISIENARLYHTAQEAVRVRDEFVSLASHELRTPMTALRLSAKILTDGGDGLDNRRRMVVLDRMTRNIDRLQGLVGRLLDVSAIDAGQLQIEKSRTDVAEIVRDVAVAFADSVSSAGSELTVKADQPVMADVDPVRIAQIVANLVDNAVKFGAGKPIVVTVRSTPETVSLSVRDQGLGIPLAEQAEIFERYTRMHSARNFGGLGLGLYVVMEMVRAHGGTITVKSRPGEGSDFVVALPRNAGPLRAPGSR